MILDIRKFVNVFPDYMYEIITNTMIIHPRFYLGPELKYVWNWENKL